MRSLGIDVLAYDDTRGWFPFVCWVGEGEKEREAVSAYVGCVHVGGRGMCGGSLGEGRLLQGVHVVVGVAGG